MALFRLVSPAPKLALCHSTHQQLVGGRVPERADMNVTTTITISSEDLASSLSLEVKVFLIVTFGKCGVSMYTFTPPSVHE